LEIVDIFTDFTVQHVSKDKNTVVNDLAQQASGFQANRGKFSFLKKKMNVPVCQTGQSSFQLVHSATIYFTESNLVELDSLVSEIGGSRISRTSDETGKTMTVNPDDWRTPLLRYFKNPGHIIDRKVWR
jgi:rubredoxin